MSKPSAPPPPDYTPIAMASQSQLQMSQEQVVAQEAESKRQFELAQTGYANQSEQANRQYDLSDKAFSVSQDEANRQYDLANRAFGVSQEQQNRQFDQSQQAIDLSRGAADRQYALETDQFGWAKDQANADRVRNDAIINQQMAVQDESLASAREAQARYKGVYQPLEDQAVDEAKNYASPERRAQAMGAASASVAENFEAQRVAAAQSLESFGIDPSSTRYAALDAGIRANKAAAMAGASNMAGLQVDATGRALRDNAINVGRGLPSDVNAGNNTSIQAGNSGVNSGLTTTNSGANITGLPVQYGGLANGSVGNLTTAINSGTGTIGAGGQYLGYGTGAIGAGGQYLGYGTGAIGAANGVLNAGTGAIGAGNGAFAAGNGALSTWGQTLNIGYSNQVDAFKASQGSSSGFGSILGAAAGFIPGLAEGGAVPGDEAIPTHNGARVPRSASPSGGRAIDDVPARLTPGEFVVPKDVVQWKGEEHFQKLAIKAREDRKKHSPARPSPVAARPLPAAFDSRAIPVR